MSEPYRDEAHAVEEKLRQVDEELAYIESASARRPALLRESQELSRRLKEIRRSPLDDVRIATPCSARWQDMIGDDRVRHCEACDKDVYNIARMTRAEALALLTKGRPDGLCVRIFERADGTVLTSDCPVGMRRKRVRRLAVLGAGISAALGGGLYAWVEPASVGGLEGARRDHGDIHPPDPSANARVRTGAVGSFEPPPSDTDRNASSSAPTPAP